MTADESKPIGGETPRHRFSTPRKSSRSENALRSELNDLRILKLAEMYELAFERFVLEMATRVIRDEGTRQRLANLAGPKDDHHGLLVAEIKRMNAALQPEDQAALEHAALLDVIEVERAAREFYLSHVDQVRDPAVVALFRRLAREEARHVEIAEDALAASDAHAGRQRLDVGSQFRLLTSEENVPLREGRVDLGAHRTDEKL